MTETHKTPQAGRRIESGVREGYTSFLTANGALFEACAQASQSYMQQLAAINEELFGFAAGRMQKASQASETLMKCKDLGDALRIQQDWFRSASEEYMHEASRILEITTKAALSSFSPLVERASSAIEPLKKAS